MSGQWGQNLRVSIFGESHGAGIGIVLAGLPSGLAVDWDEVARELKGRAPGQNAMSTTRKEADVPKPTPPATRRASWLAPWTWTISSKAWLPSAMQ